MMYFEPSLTNPKERLLCRTENFVPFSPNLASTLNGKLLDVCSDLFGSEAVLFKEKINFKLPGGDGFKPHQDVAAGWDAYKQSIHISALICVDPANEENGALEVVRNEQRHGVIMMWKPIPDDVCDRMKWELIETQPGDIVLFDSFVPHRSGPNNSNKSRRAMYATYAMQKEGDFREQYFKEKRANFPPDIEREEGKVYEYKI